MLPSHLNGAEAEDKLSVRPISMEEAFARQNDRIAYLRSCGEAWAEAVYELRDLLVGLEDAEFWDGVPDHERDNLDALEEASLKGETPQTRRQAARMAQEVRGRWKNEGWLTYPVRAFRGPDGEPIYRPTSENLSQALRIVRRLATRRGITWRTKRVTRLTRPGGGDDA